MRVEASGGCIPGIHDDSGHGRCRAGLNHLAAGIGNQDRADALSRTRRGISESIRLQSLKGLPARRNPVVEPAPNRAHGP